MFGPTSGDTEIALRIFPAMLLRPSDCRGSVHFISLDHLLVHIRLAFVSSPEFSSFMLPFMYSSAYVLAYVRNVVKASTLADTSPLWFFSGRPPGSA